MASQFVFDAIGTHWVIDISDLLDKKREEAVLQEIKGRIAVFDKHYSRFRDDSLVAQISKSAGKYVLPADARKMFDLYRFLYDLTGGLVTPLIGQALVDAGYDSKYSLTQHRTLRKPIGWDEALVYKHPNLEVKVPVLLDFGAAGKGYLIDIVGDILAKNGLKSFCVDAGGDMLYRNPEKLRLKVGLEHPADPDKVVGVASILNQSICGSAGNRRAWGDFHHIINPETLVSPKHILAIWTIAENTLIADVLTTALFFINRGAFTPHFNFESFILYADYSFEKSDGLNAEIFST